tara:strand:- start:5887 stop:6573 length:687 start_codon:yes stop_codon:yes gene_type:complete
MNKKQLKADVKEDFGGELIAKITTESIDRDGEVLIPQGMNAVEYEANPVLFWNHDYAQPVGKVKSLSRQSDHVLGSLEFAKRPDGYQGEFFPSFAEALVRQGIVRGVSVGFLPEDGGMRNATRGDKAKYGTHVKRVFNRWKLLEVSLAPLPSNQEALIAAVDKGLVDGMLVKKFLGIELPACSHKISLTPKRKRHLVGLVDSSEQKERAEIELTVRAEVARHKGQIYY